jgi:NADPH:quinone reductase-like Zn-dependent oxidoreductase
MRAWAIEGGFGLENLRLGERDEPPCGPGQVAIDVGAVSLNYRDRLMVAGLYNPKQPLPLVPCSDGMGRVVSVGEGVTRVKVGDRVAGTFVQDWIGGPIDWEIARSTLGGPRSGMLAERVVLPEHGVVRVPAHLSDAEAATLPCAGVTAWTAVVASGEVTAGQTVLLQGTGGVSIFALQLAKLVGARVLITSSSDEKLALARGLGADETINYRTDPEWGRTAKTLSGGAGVDLGVNVGGPATFEQSMRAVRMGGRIALVGNLSGNEAKIRLTDLLMRQIRVQGLLVGSRTDFEAMNRALAQHALRPVLDRVFAFEDAPAAIEHLGRGAHFGKVAITVGGGADTRA